MPDLHLPEDEAIRYVLGELSPAERRDFEARLEESAELRGLVRELEEGAVALSMATPKRRPPKELWARVERVVTSNARRIEIPAFWSSWWRSGWAAAAACLVGWLLYALFAGRPATTEPARNTVASGNNLPPGTTAGPVGPDKPANVTRQSPPENNAALQLLQARTQEIGALSWQIAELTNRLSYLAQAVTQQQALLSESSRLKFFELAAPSTAAGTSPTMTPVSTNLQRALFIAMARELGWVPATSSASTEPGRSEERQGNPAVPSQTNQVAGVDFVDLRPGTNTVETSVTEAPREPRSEARNEWGHSTRSEPTSVASASSGAVPGFISGTNAVLAFDSSVVPAGTLLSFWSGFPGGQFQPLGSATLSTSPMVVTMPYAFASWEGGGFSVLATFSNGQTNILRQFSTPGTGGP